ncbi:hypothetical protein WOLCODRAFT_19294 [Wolfiporia cocos MD-104 SS10]|uniref:DUF6534 domain-containing protein n=1 Tax=Wolfiporia cocos (strain MD-104) TaxID=742152 RepID=A0A2H3JSQ6_WOLCO|nr:hypothetical protein WOLCODRAFT_19294 [Wolfiporia cocos MD-104 SS10]
MGELDATYGAVLIGVFASAVLYGVTNVQVYVFFREYPRDVIWNKVAVSWLWLLDSVHLALCFHMVYWYLITNYARPTQLLLVVWSFKAQIILDVSITRRHSWIRLYVIRVWKLNAVASKELGLAKLTMPILVSFAMLAGYEREPLRALVPPAAAALVLCWAITRYSYYTEFSEPKNMWVTYYPLATATAVDAVIATCLCRLLVRCKTGFRETDSIISRLMFYTLNTGFITSLCSLLAIVMMAVFPHDFAMISVEFSLTKGDSIIVQFAYLQLLSIIIRSVHQFLYGHPLHLDVRRFNARKSLRFSGPNSKDLSPRYLTATDTSDRTSNSALNSEHGHTHPFPGKSRYGPDRGAVAVKINKDIVSEELGYKGHVERDNVELNPLPNL